MGPSGPKFFMDQIPLSPTNWQAFFDAHAPHYDKNPFVSATSAEVDFFLTLFPIPLGSSILDIGCGTGRHSVELARRGYKVTGVDFSRGMLDVARSKSEAAQVEVDWIQQDACSLNLDSKFDAALCVCEGALGVLGEHDNPENHDQMILDGIGRCLKQGGGFLLTALNAYSALRRMTDEMVAERFFDPVKMIATYPDEWELPEGKQVVMVRERLFTPPETVAMLNKAGFDVRNVYGGTAGNWGRRPLSLDEIEAMYICVKQG